jgi:FtsZ-binding cell division protein ZapB
MKPQEVIAQLEQENQQLKDQVSGLQKRLEELKEQKKQDKPSKSRLQAEAALALLKQGPVTKAQLVELNAKYPSDPIYYVRTLLHLDVKSVKTKDGSVYMLPEHHAVYVEGVRREEEAAAALVAAKEAVPASQAEAIA